MSVERNLAVVRRFVDDVINGEDESAIDELIGPDYVDHGALPGEPGGPERVRRAMRGVRAAFLDFHFDVQEILPAGDKVVLRGVVSGTHQGNFLGIPATGKAIRVTQMHLVRVEDGRIVEHWAESDWLCAVYQLEAVPAFLQPA